MDTTSTKPGGQDPRREEMRRTMVAAARRLFARDGFAETSVDDIVLAAAVSRSVFYTHFEDRREIFQAVAAAEHSTLGAVLKEALRKEGLDPYDALVAAMRTFLETACRREVRQILIVDGPVVLGRDAWSEIDRANLGRCLEEGLRRAMKAGVLDPLPPGPLVDMLSAALWAGLSTLEPEPAPKAMADRIRVAEYMLRGMRAAKQTEQKTGAGGGPMNDRFIVTPYYLEQAVPGLVAVADPDWALNNPSFEGESEQERLASTHVPLAEFVAETVKAGDRPVSIAGDCCTAIAMVAGLQRGGVDASLIWVDAHGDFNTQETTPSNFLGGMPLAMIVGLGDMTMPDAVGLKPLAENKVVLSDGRNLDPLEAELLAKSKVSLVRSFADLADMALPDGPLYVHFDSDVIDAGEAPAHNYPEPGGPSSEEVKAVFKRLKETGRVVAASMSAWNPDLDEDGRTGRICMECFGALL